MTQLQVCMNMCLFQLYSLCKARGYAFSPIAQNMYSNPTSDKWVAEYRKLYFHYHQDAGIFKTGCRGQNE